jgi:hypothetical protein
MHTYRVVAHCSSYAYIQSGGTLQVIYIHTEWWHTAVLMHTYRVVAHSTPYTYIHTYVCTYIHTEWWHTAVHIQTYRMVAHCSSYTYIHTEWWYTVLQEPLEVQLYVSEAEPLMVAAMANFRSLDSRA